MTAGSAGGRQLLLDFPRLDPAVRPLISGGPWAHAAGAIRRWRSWPEGQLALTGAPFSGRSRLLRYWAVEAGAAVVAGPVLGDVDLSTIANLSIGALAIDDADRCSSGRALLAAVNLCRDRSAPLLLAGGGQPGSWFSDPLDLRSRLQAMPTAAIGEPDEWSLAVRLIEECARRYIALPADSAAYLAQRMERSWAAVDVLSDEIERSPDKASSPRNARNVLISLGMDPG